MKFQCFRPYKRRAEFPEFLYQIRRGMCSVCRKISQSGSQGLHAARRLSSGERPPVRYVRKVDFNSKDYGTEVARILSLDGNGTRPMPLAPGGCASTPAREEIQHRKAPDLFPNAHSPEGAMAGLYLYFSCFDEAHTVAQDLNTADGSFWHGIVHRQEPDPGNAAYWFRRVGKHPVFPALRDEAHRIRFDTGREWDPFEFIEFCESARLRPGSEEEKIAMQVQLVEWQLLFDYCAKEKTR